MLFSQENVGIGTTTPQARLDILSTGDGMELLRLSTDRPWVFRQRFTGPDTRLTLQSTVDLKSFEILSADGLQRAAEFQTSNVLSRVLLVPDGGDVGIGVATPEARLDIDGGDWNLPAGNPGDLRIGNPTFNFRIGVATGGGGAGTVRMFSNGGNLLLGTENTSRLSISTTGKVGIGMTAADAKLDIVGGDWDLDSGNPGDLRIGNAVHNLRIGVATDGGGAGTVRMYSNGGSLILGTQNTPRVFVTTSGHVGVGTDTPDARLEVVNPVPFEKAVFAEVTSLNEGNISLHSKVHGPYGTAVFGEIISENGGIGIHGEVAGGTATAIFGHATSTTGSSVGVHARIHSPNGYALFTESTSTVGQNHGIWSSNASNEGVGVYGVCTSPTGSTTSIYGWNYSTGGRAVQGIASATTGSNIGVGGTTYSSSGIGVFGTSTSGTGNTYGVFGNVESSSGVAVYGSANATSGNTYGVRGNSVSPDGSGVFGHATSNSGPNRGVYGNTNSDEGIGVYGIANKTFGETRGVSGKVFSTDGVGVYGEAFASSGENYGVYGVSTSPSGTGVYGEATSSGGITYGVHGKATGGGPAIYAEHTRTSGSAVAIVGESASTGGIGVYGASSATTGTTYGVFGTTPSTSGVGVYGIVNATSGTTTGVYGFANSSSGRAVYGSATGDSGKALYGYATGIYGKGLHAVATGSHSSVNAILADADAGSAYAGYFIGRVHITGNLSKGGGSFKIDHPLDPANKYLYHSFVESPDMMNIYNGNVTTDGSGYATVELPEYFDALNMEFRYQLTVIGDFAQAIISEKISGNRFSIRTDKPNIEVSWMVTGIRKDKWAEANRIVPEVDKEPENRGKYLAPELFGSSSDNMIGRVPAAEKE